MLPMHAQKLLLGSSKFKLRTYEPIIGHVFKKYDAAVNNQEEDWPKTNEWIQDLVSACISD